jgi:hypothetical protein
LHATACQTGFVNKTGGHEGGAAGEDADTKFAKWCHRDPVVLFMWLHWGRGQNVPAHCTAMLAPGSGMDIGVAAGQPPPPAHKQRASPQKSSSFEQMLQAHMAEASAARTALLSKLLHAAALFALRGNVHTGWMLQLDRQAPSHL